jgi:hypothetical protein
LNSLEFIKILKIVCVLVVPILFIGNPRQGKMQVAMKGARVVTTTIPIVKAKVVLAIVLVLKVEVATPIVKAEEVAAAPPTTKVEVAKKKQRVKLPKLKMNVDRHRLPNGDLQKSFDARVCLLCQVYLHDYHVKWLV